MIERQHSSGCLVPSDGLNFLSETIEQGLVLFGGNQHFPKNWKLKVCTNIESCWGALV